MPYVRSDSQINALTPRQATTSSKQGFSDKLNTEASHSLPTAFRTFESLKQTPDQSHGIGDTHPSTGRNTNREGLCVCDLASLYQKYFYGCFPSGRLRSKINGTK